MVSGALIHAGENEHGGEVAEAIVQRPASGDVRNERGPTVIAVAPVVAVPPGGGARGFRLWAHSRSRQGC